MIFLLLRRLVQTALILFGVAAITFLLLYALPADPARDDRRPQRNGPDGRQYPP